MARVASGSASKADRRGSVDVSWRKCFFLWEKTAMLNRCGGMGQFDWLEGGGSVGLSLADFLNGLRVMTLTEGLEKTAILQRIFGVDCVSSMCMDVLTVIYLIEGHWFWFQLLCFVIVCGWKCGISRIVILILSSAVIRHSCVHALGYRQVG
jgi:hypothetical protein